MKNLALLSGVAWETRGENIPDGKIRDVGRVDIAEMEVSLSTILSAVDSPHRCSFYYHYQ
jgi:hypothetical protein